MRDALIENFRTRGELGAAVAVTLDGQPVVDVWAGWMDEERTRPWHRDTLVDVFSLGKAMTTLCVLLLVERGHVGLDAPVSRYWPEFAASGKADVTVRMLLSHRAGVPAVRRELPAESIYDWDAMVAALAAEEPWWEPGSTHGYHVNTFGFLTGEVVRRVSGASVGEFFRREVAQPLEADFHFGLDARDDARTADYLLGGEGSAFSKGVEEQRPVEPDEATQFLLNRVYLNPPQLSGLGTVEHTRLAGRRDPVRQRPRHGVGSRSHLHASWASCSARQRSRRRSRRTRTGWISSLAAPRDSGSGFSSRRPSGRWVRTRAASATSAWAGRLALPTSMRDWPSPTS